MSEIEIEDPGTGRQTLAQKTAKLDTQALRRVSARSHHQKSRLHLSIMAACSGGMGLMGGRKTDPAKPLKSLKNSDGQQQLLSSEEEKKSKTIDEYMKESTVTLAGLGVTPD